MFKDLMVAAIVVLPAPGGHLLNNVIVCFFSYFVHFNLHWDFLVLDRGSQKMGDGGGGLGSGPLVPHFWSTPKLQKDGE